MEKYLNRFYDVIDKIGKHNFILIIFIFVAILSTGFYQTFSLYTESEGLSILNDIKTYSFILKNNGEENSIMVAANSSKNVDITVTNESESNLKYGLYYSSSLIEEDINIGYLTSTVHQPSGVVPKSTSYVVTIKVDNLTEENVTINFGLKYGFESGGDLGIDEGEYWFLEYEEIVNYPLLSEMPVGSYVAYTGNNGCDTTDVGGWTSCSGKNANYVDETDMGYCHDSNYKFNVNGWRIGYVNGGSAHLVASGSTDCLSSISYSTVKSSIMTTNNIGNFDGVYYGSNYTYNNDSGTYSIQDYDLYSWSELEKIIGELKYTCQLSSISFNTCFTLYEIDESSTDSEVRYYTYTRSVNGITADDHIENLNNIGLKYCNTTYSKDGICDNTTAWGINAVDFEKITDISLGSDSCYGISNSAECGYNNNLINNGSYYWFGTQLDYSNNIMFYWQPYNYVIDSNTSDNDYGVRPILMLDSSVVVTGGAGTYEDPYTISNE